MKVKQFAKDRYAKLVKIEERSEVIEGLISKKLKLIKQKEEMVDLVKSVELNIQPTEFKNLVQSSSEAEKDDAPKVTTT
jgi:hypothetical protein